MINLISSQLQQRGLAPDWLTRLGIQQQLARRLMAPDARQAQARHEQFRHVIERAGTGPLNARVTSQQASRDDLLPHNYDLISGTHGLHGCHLFDDQTDNLAQAEHAMLALIVDRARIRDRQRILDLGCGRGALSLWIAQRYPNVQIQAVAQTRTQHAAVQTRARELGLDNITVHNCPITQFVPEVGNFDRILCFEQLGRIRNLQALFATLASWLYDHGRLFVQMYAHKFLAYRLTDDPLGDWLARDYFGGSNMPSENLFAHFQQDLVLKDSWWLSGHHYRRTALSWLSHTDHYRAAILDRLGSEHAGAAQRQLEQWRYTCLALASLFGYGGGDQWGVGHYLMTPRRALA